MSRKGGRKPQVPAKPPAPQNPKPQQVNTIRAVASQSWQGPLPSPADLAKFDEVIPGLAERIVTMAEAEGKHSRRTQFIAVATASVSQVLGQVFALAVALGGLYAAYWLAMKDHDGVAMVVGGATITTIAGAFLQHRRNAKAAI